MRYLVPLGFLLASTTLASAADFGGPSYDGSLKDAPLAAPAPVWSGLYLGAHGGWAGGSGWSGDFFYQGDALGHGYGLDAEGWYGGVQAGANQQFGNVVVGIEADVSFGDLGESDRFEANGLTGHGARVVWEMDQSLETFGTVRARLGYLPSPSLLVYATGGFAWGKTSASQVIHYPDDIPAPIINGYGKVDETHLGWTIGGGFEWALGSRLSVKGEYLYIDLGEEDYHFVGKRGNPPTIFYADDSAPSDLDFHTVRLGVNYKFGSGQ